MDELIAWTHIPISQAVLSGETHEDWFPLTGKQGEGQEGMINLVLSYSVSEVVYRDGILHVHLGKAVPLQAWSGPEGSRKLRFPDFMTRAQDGGKVVSLTHRPPLSPGNTPGTHFC